MGGTELNYINDAFDKNWIAPLGENVTEFENSMKDYVGVDAAVAVGSGTSAIHLALIESGVQKMMLFCSSLTFSASANQSFIKEQLRLYRLRNELLEYVSRCIT